MSKFKENMVVGVIVDNVIRKGTIRTLYHDVSVAIIEFSDGDVKKVHFSGLVILEDTEAENEPVEEVREEPIKEDTITITREDFMVALIEAISPSKLRELPGSQIMDDQEMFVLSMSGMVIGHSIERVLFGKND